MKYRSYKPHSCLRSLSLRMSAPLFTVVILSLSAPAIWAGSATWNGNPVDNQWYNPNNWTPATVPDGPTDIATFGTTSQPAITISDSSDHATVLNGITFNSNASTYILTVPSTQNNLSFMGNGVVNNSSQTQTFVINGNGVNDVSFTDATAGNNVSYQFVGAQSDLDFHGSATAGSASFTCEYAYVSFFDDASAGNATFTLNGGSHLNFLSSTGNDGANGTFILNGSDTRYSFMDCDRTVFAHATFTVNGTSGLASNYVYVSSEVADAGNSTFTVNGAIDASHFPGLVRIQYDANPGSATLVANPGLNGGAGGKLSWVTITRNRARVELFGSGNGDVTNGTFDATLITGPHNDISVGSLEGTGLVELGTAALSIGTNDLDTTFAGTIHDAGGGTNGSGSLTKTGTGILTLSGANTYTGKTTVVAGTLLVTNRTGSATGTGPVIINGGVLGGTGKISGAVTVGSATRFGTISPGLAGRAGRLTISRPVTFKQFGIYNADLDSTRVTADQVVATGVTIGSGATINVTDLGAAVLPSGTVLTIINNRAAIPISGTFGNLADGSTLTVGSNTYLVSYEGGTGNDLTLTVQ